MPATADAPQLLDDAMLEAAADSFGAAFAEAAPRDAVWLRAPGPATSPRGVVQCSGGRPQHVLNLRNQVLQDDFEEDEDEDEEDEVDQPMQGPSGAKSMATTNSGTAKSIAGPTRTVIGVGVSATNTVSSVLGGTDIAPVMPPAMPVRRRQWRRRRWCWGRSASPWRWPISRCRRCRRPAPTPT
jgi:hypothetical protein